MLCSTIHRLTTGWEGFLTRDRREMVLAVTFIWRGRSYVVEMRLA